MRALALSLLLACGSSPPPTTTAVTSTRAHSPVTSSPHQPPVDDRVYAWTDAVAAVDEADPSSIERATAAADGLGATKQGLDALIGLAQKPPTKHLIGAEIAAIRALGKFDGDKAKAAAALAKIVAREPPQHPRTARDKEQATALEPAYGLYLASTGAAVNAIAELRTPAAVPQLVAAMYRTPELFTQTRRALVASGPAAKAALRGALRGDNAEVTKLFADHHLDCGDGDAPCKPVSAREFYAAVVLGDFYDPDVVPELLAVLKRPTLPVYYIDGEPSPNTQHHAVFDALRKIGADTAAPLRALWSNKQTDVTTRTLAVATYAFVARDASAVAELGKIAADNSADDSLRQEAATAYARLSIDAKDIALLQTLAQKYVDASAKKAKEAAPRQKEAAAADQAYEAAKQALDAVRAKALMVAHDSKSSVDEIKTATSDVKRGEDTFRAAKLKHKERVAPFKSLDSAAKAYAGYARMFQSHIARIEIAARCKTDLACYGAMLATPTPDVTAKLASYIPDLASWSADDKHGLAIAEIDRALLEIGKQGAKASELTDALLDVAESEERLVRGGVLLALPKIAKLPCDRCEAKLDAAIRAGEGKPALGDLNLETMVLRNYFIWAGRAAHE